MCMVYVTSDSTSPIERLTSSSLGYNNNNHNHNQNNYNYKKTGTRQYTRADWSTFAEIHSRYPPGSLMHYLELLEFPVRICDTLHITTHMRRA